MSRQFGASFSVPYAQYLEIEPEKCLKAAITELGIKRLRLMSYWNRLEAVQDVYDFTELDWQMDLAKQFNVQVMLCLGLRQPRWPENHWPEWAKLQSKNEWKHSLMDFIRAVVERYKDHPSLIGWQLENEAMLKRFGKDGDFDRNRLRAEFKMVKDLDPDHPVIMTCSDSWGVPFFGPRPDQYGFSIYRYFYDKNEYRHSKRPAFFYTIRAFIIKGLKWRGAFIHELQAEPWGPAGIMEMTLEEQFKSINRERVKEAVDFATATRLNPIDIWGLEWWFYLKDAHDKSEIWDDMKKVYQE